MTCCIQSEDDGKSFNSGIKDFRKEKKLNLFILEIKKARTNIKKTKEVEL